ncbi:hypothetical protein [Bacillus thuringiensis]|uniref:hypothetical protein n=1 Tax=Bacillus thuringiensis TaxID=1428 RepID=UPI002FBD861B
MKNAIPFEIASLYLYNNKGFLDFLQELPSIDIRMSQESRFLNNIIVAEDSLVFYNEKLLWMCSRDLKQTHLGDIGKFEEYFKRFEITKKEFVNFLFEKEFSDNLMEMFIDGEYIYDYFEDQLIYGTQLNFSQEYEKIIRNDDIKIIDAKMQPLNISSSITLRNENIIEFNNKNNVNENVYILYIISKYIMNYLQIKDDIK